MAVIHINFSQKMSTFTYLPRVIQTGIYVFRVVSTYVLWSSRSNQNISPEHYLRFQKIRRLCRDRSNYRNKCLKPMLTDGGCWSKRCYMKKTCRSNVCFWMQKSYVLTETGPLPNTGSRECAHEVYRIATCFSGSWRYNI